MDRRSFLAIAALPALYPLQSHAQARKTDVTIRGDAFYINGRPTYAGRMFDGKRVEGLLMNIRVVQGIFDDLNPDTAARWVYPDTKRWDPDRNTTEFMAAMPEWKRHGVLAFTINLQGGSAGFAGGRGRGRGAAETGGTPLRVRAAPGRSQRPGRLRRPRRPPSRAAVSRGRRTCRRTRRSAGCPRRRPRRRRSRPWPGSRGTSARE